MGLLFTNMHNITILDIETIALPEADIRAKLPPFRPEKVALGNLKDPDKIAAKIEEARRTHGDTEVDRGALNATTGTLAIVGFMDGNGVVTQYHVGEMSERNVLNCAFCDMLAVLDAGGVISGYGIKFFDIIFIVQRAWLLGVKVPARIFNGFKPRYPFSESVVCLQEVWLAGSGAPFGTRVALRDVLAELGLPPKSGSGAQFGEIWAADKDAGLAYNAQDLTCEMALANRLL
jgi:hypothetical protein